MMRFEPILRALDADRDGVISASEIANATKTLMTLDRNKDGKLSEDELRPEFGGGFPGGRFPGGPGGRFPGGRFPGGPGGRPGATAAPDTNTILGRFMVFDENKDGKLSREELPQRLHSLLTRADVNKDGVATQEEITALLKKEAAGAGQGGTRGGERGGRPRPDRRND
jgi:Ca2+-binding EF-hand superfamily protein